jgi:zinc protease
VLSFIVLAAIVALRPNPAVAQATSVPAQNVITMPSPSSLYEVQIMVRAGSADDPAGKEGTANLVASMLLEGGFGDPQNPVTKDKLAEITRPWGEAAFPQVLVDKQTTTFSMIVPREALPQFVAQVLQPMFRRPLFLDNELDRIRKETLVRIQSNLRFEQQELLGLLALDNWVLAGTPLDHLSVGTVQGVQAVKREDLESFYKKYYTGANVYVATSVGDHASLGALLAAMPEGAQPAATPVGKPEAIDGRHLLIVTQPNAIATGLHLGFPIDVKRGDPDYWPLFVANVYLGAHRDSFGRMYQEIRGDRGFNYGDYCYLEYLSGRPFFLFPPPTTPRQQQYFSIWIRPVAHQYTHFILKAMTWELENLIKNGMTPEQVAAAKVKARTLYLKYADSKSRQLGYRLDDQFYGLNDHGYLVDMLKNLDAVTPEQVNAAIHKHLQSANLKYVIVTNESAAGKLADDVAANTNVTPKTLEEYHISQPIPPEKQKMLDQDKEWIAVQLGIPRENIHIVKAGELFETTAIPGAMAGAQK